MFPFFLNLHDPTHPHSTVSLTFRLYKTLIILLKVCMTCTIASPTWWTWVWASSGSWWWTGKPGMLESMGSQGVGHKWATELNSLIITFHIHNSAIKFWQWDAGRSCWERIMGLSFKGWLMQLESTCCPSSFIILAAWNANMMAWTTTVILKPWDKHFKKGEGEKEDFHLWYNQVNSCWTQW